MCEKSFSVFIYIPFLTFTITLIGISTNSWVLAMSKKSSSMVGSFGTITRNQAVCNVLMCLIFISTVLPMQLGFFESLIPHSHYLGTAAMTVHEVSNSAHFLMSFNRFCAFYMPHHYEKLFRLIMLASNKDLWSRTKKSSVVIFVQAQQHITKIGYR
ncbi:unnamed protein product [Caenorhabditis nigoni]